MSKLLSLDVTLSMKVIVAIESLARAKILCSWIVIDSGSDKWLSSLQ